MEFKKIINHKWKFAVEKDGKYKFVKYKEWIKFPKNKRRKFRIEYGIKFNREEINKEFETLLNKLNNA